MSEKEQPPRNPLEGVLEEEISGRQRERVLNADTQEALALLAQEAEQETERQKELSTKDELTGILNRRGFLEQVERVVSSIPTETTEYIRREGFRSMALAMLDVDHFKDFNDTLGHSTGDAVLRSMAQHLAQELRLRTTDIVARYGGEEFIVAFPGASEEDVLRKLSELRKAADDGGKNGVKLAESVKGRKLVITMSCGVTSFRPGEKIDETIARADKALYAAKEAGRDQSVVYDPETMAETDPGHAS